MFQYLVLRVLSLRCGVDRHDAFFFLLRDEVRCGLLSCVVFSSRELLLMYRARLSPLRIFHFGVSSTTGDRRESGCTRSCQSDCFGA